LEKVSGLEERNYTSGMVSNFLFASTLTLALLSTPLPFQASVIMNIVKSWKVLKKGPVAEMYHISSILRRHRL
jgi:hypothetical protein